MIDCNGRVADIGHGVDPLEIRHDVAHAIRCMHFGLVCFAHVRIMRTSPKWSLLP